MRHIQIHIYYEITSQIAKESVCFIYFVPLLLKKKGQNSSDRPWGIPECATRGWHCSYSAINQNC